MPVEERLKNAGLYEKPVVSAEHAKVSELKRVCRGNVSFVVGSAVM